MSFNSSNPVIVFGRVPLFYFVTHFYLAHIASVVLALAKYGSAAWGFVFHPAPSMGGPAKLFRPTSDLICGGVRSVGGDSGSDVLGLLMVRGR